jgi:GGDEF domain-containing protein
VPEPVDPATPATAPRPRRSRKFVLPDHHHDERVDERAAEHIEAFLDGPVAAPRRRPAAEKRVRHPLELDTRPDWMVAFRQEGARHARYGRAASVLLIELHGAEPGGATDRIARSVADAIRAGARETDRATRIDAMSFRLLLPETGGRAARSVAERLHHAFAADLDGQAEGVVLCIEVASATRNGSLEDALADAEQRLTARALAG